MQTKKNIEVLQKFKTALNIKYIVSLKEVNEVIYKMNKIKIFSKNIKHCLFNKYNLRTLNRINGNLSQDHKRTHIIIVQINRNINYIFNEKYKSIFNSQNDFTIIYKDPETFKKINSFLLQKKLNVFNKVYLNESDDSFLPSASFLNAMTHIIKGVSLTGKYKDIKMFLQVSQFNGEVVDVLPIKKDITKVICTNFENKIDLFYPTKKLWSDNITNSYIHFALLYSIFKLKKENLLLDSKKLKDNLDKLDEKIKDLEKSKRLEEALVISDELNILQDGGDNENN